MNSFSNAFVRAVLDSSSQRGRVRVTKKPTPETCNIQNSQYSSLNKAMISLHDE